jgi:hypothetical protein
MFSEGVRHSFSYTAGGMQEDDGRQQAKENVNGPGPHT